MIAPEKIETSPDRISALFNNQKAFFRSGATMSVHDRIKRLRDFEAFLLRNQARITKEIYKDFGKPVSEVLISELYPVLTEIRHAVSNLTQWTKPKKVDAPLTYLGTRSSIQNEPKGVCLIISPWNFPFNLCFGPLISCLAAGNTAILKPSELTPAASALIGQLTMEFFHEELVAVVEGNADVSTQLLKLPFDHIFFTGSPAVGKIIMKAAAENLSSVTLELGGKSPTIIDATANLKDAARRISFGKFLNNGQTCIAPDYVLVEESVRERFIDELIRSTLRMYGDGEQISELSTQYGRIVNDKNFQRLNSLLQDAVQRGAKIEFSGQDNADKRFIHPVVLSSIALDAEIMVEEIFGPILPVVSFKKVNEVIRIINAKPKPLALYIFSEDADFKKQIISDTSSGAVCINDCILQFSHPDLPFGGVNHSGIGKAHGYYGFMAFSNEKPIVRQKRGYTASYLIQPPYTKNVKKIIEFMIKWI